MLSSDQITALRREPNFVHVKSQSETSESRWQTLYKLESRITGDRNLTVADYIPEALRRIRFEARYLTEQLQALDLLKDAPTARLERVFAEHIDCCTYRLDAWMLGLVNFQLEAMRSRPTPLPSPTEPPVPRIAAAATTPPPTSQRQGLYLGAYGWLENVRPENKPLRPKTLEPELEDIFNPGSTDPEQPPRSPLRQDLSNGGYIHAPSLNHAVTAAVLRNGYISSATSANRKTMAVNLSSERVRRALGVLEGIRGGQSLGTLLGYQLERGLHDRHNLAEVDEFIYKLRKAFPLRADRLSTTRTDETVSIEVIEARNVIDGLSLVNHIKKTGNATYPFGKSLPAATPAQATAINAEVNRLLDLHDAVADLALAESVHQAVQGNYDRAAATLDTYSKGNFPPDPEVVQTPRSGITLTHRVGLHLKPVASAASPFSDIPLTPRAQAEPALNQWLATVLPAPDDVACKVTYTDPSTGNPIPPVIVTQKDLQIQPIDLLYLVRTESQPAMGELDDRILNHVLNTQSLRPDTPIQLLYTERIEDKISFFELSALVGHWRSLILRSQPLKSSDITLPTANVQGQELVFCDRSRVTAIQTALTDLLSTELTAFQTQLEPLIANPVANRDAILNGIDTTIDDFIGLMQSLNRFGLPQSGWGIAVDQRRQVFETLIAQVKALTNRWEARLASFNTQLAEYDALPPETADAVRIERLKDLERLVASVPSGEPPVVPDEYRTVVVTQFDLFADQLMGFQNVLSTSTRSIATLLSQIKALLPMTQFEVEPFELKDTEDRLLTFAADLLAIAQSVGRDAQKRLDTVTAQLTLHDNSANPSDHVKALQTAAQALLGDDFKLIPEFELAPAQANGWQNAFAASQSGELFRHLTDTVGIDFPADDWLYGVARMRDALWMLTRQWQLGEFQGDDAGSPVFAKLHMDTTQLTKYQADGHSPEAFENDTPLESKVERRPIPFTQGNQTIALDLRLLMGRQWLKLTRSLPSGRDYARDFCDRYPIALPNPNNPADALVCAHLETWQTVASAAGRRMDGYSLYTYLKTDPAHHAYDGMTVDAADQATLDTQAAKFIQWFERLYNQPPVEDAWVPDRLEYQFACSAPTQSGEQVFVADEYYQGHLDWYNLNIDPNSDGLGPIEPPAPDPQTPITQTLIPDPVIFDGMPNTRWWAFEDRRTNFGDIKPDTTDIAKLLLIEFGLVYANDWFLVPFTLPVGSIAKVRGLVVTNVFGERTWIEAAGAGADDSWQRWSMFTINTQGDADELADTSLLLLPTVPKIQESSPLEEVLLVRDEMANMVWGIEKTVPMVSGDSKSGGEAATELHNLYQRLLDGQLAADPSLSNPIIYNADLRYRVMTTVPENWIPFIPVHREGDNREVQLQRAAMPRILEGNPNRPRKIRPRTTLLRQGLDQKQAYYLHEEEVPRAGVRMTQSFQRTRWQNGRVVVWLGVHKETGRGEASSRLAFDRLESLTTARENA